jgi:hypothetical protein
LPLNEKIAIYNVIKNAESKYWSRNKAAPKIYEWVDSSMAGFIDNNTILTRGDFTLPRVMFSTNQTRLLPANMQLD